MTETANSSDAEVREPKWLQDCRGEELEFEKWAQSKNYDMHEHPLHYLFLNEKTYAARQGWKSALEYCARQLSTRPIAGEAVQAQVLEEIGALETAWIKEQTGTAGYTISKQALFSALLKFFQAARDALAQQSQPAESVTPNWNAMARTMQKLHGAKGTEEKIELSLQAAALFKAEK